MPGKSINITFRNAIALAWLVGCLSAFPLPLANAQAAGAAFEEKVTVNNVALVMLRDVHPLYGGQNLYLRRDGTGYCQVVFPHQGIPPLMEKRYSLELSAEAMQKLLESLAAHAFHQIPSSVKPGVPDAAKPVITVRLASGKSVSVARWERDHHPDFHAIYRTLLSIAKEAQAGKTVAETIYNPKFGAEVFGPN